MECMELIINDTTAIIKKLCDDSSTLTGEVQPLSMKLIQLLACGLVYLYIFFFLTIP